MGDPRKHRKKYKTPGKPWEATRIEEERKIIHEYGLKNKKEIWKNESFLRRIKRQVRRLIPDVSEQGKKEREQLVSRLIKLNLIKQGAKVDDVLALETKDILERRLQTFVFKKNLAKTVKQARQFIVHGHVMVNGRKMNVPSYLVLKDEENKITFSSGSELSKVDHPERFKEKKVVDVKTDLKEKTKKEEVKKVEEKPKVEDKKVEPKVEVKEEPKEEKKEEVKEEPKVEVKKEEPTVEIKEVEVSN